MSWLENQARDCGPICEIVKIGDSFEGNELKAMRVSIYRFL